MREVTKPEFKRLYFRLGKSRGGWDEAYWNGAFERETRPGMKFLVEEPKSRRHSRMMIVTDFEANEHRLFFLTDEEEDNLFDFPGEGL
jgi:hypothetical protein